MELKRILKAPSKIGDLVFELLNSSTRVHIFHMSVKGEGSYAAHKATAGFYEDVQELADSLAEQWQGLTGTLLSYPRTYEFPPMENAGQCVAYLKSLYAQVDDFEKSCSYSEICNTLDEIKSLINSTCYKLLFLK